MESNKYFPKFLGEERLGFFYVSPYYSLKIDESLRSIWIDLETKKELYSKKKVGGFNFLVKRVTFNSQNDFIIDFPEKFINLFIVFERYSLPIPKIIELILNPNLIGESNIDLFNFIEEQTKNFSEEDRLYLVKFVKFIQTLHKEKINNLLSDKKYTIIFGSLSLEEKVNNIVCTQKNQEMKTQKLTQKDVEECFSGLILSKNTYNEVFNAVGLIDILSDPPTFPKSGGAIFIDQGGTGKSMMKSALKKLWRKIGGECIEKNGIAEFSGDTNYARLIQSWYFGNNRDDEKGYDKEGMFNAALKNGVPSLLIIDEADRFVRTTSGEYRDTGAELIINEFKRYLTSRDKGGVLGYVITIFIANVDENELNTQLKMGGERLKPIYFGPPTIQKAWLELINLYFKKNNLSFKNRDDKFDILLSNLILEHNKAMPHEKYMISPREFGDNFCRDYLNKYFGDEEKNNLDNLNLFSMLHIGRKDKKVELEYQVFLKHLIDDLLLKKISLAGLNINSFTQKYYNFVGINSSTFSKFSPEERRELNLILTDEVVKRIISANYVYEVLDIQTPDSFNDSEYLKRIIRGLISKIGAQRYQFKDKNNLSHNIRTDIGKALLADLFNKLPNSGISLNDIKNSAVSIDFSKYF